MIKTSHQMTLLVMIVNLKEKGRLNKISFSMITASSMMSFFRIGRKELGAPQSNNLYSSMRKILKLISR